MRISPFLIAVTTSCLLMTPCQSGWQEDYAQITDGVPVLEMSGSPGSVAVLGQNAFPIAESITRQAVVAGGYFGDSTTGGRVLALAHTSFASAKAAVMQRWLSNALKWTSRKEHPDVLVLGGPANDWIAGGARVVATPRPWNPEVLSKLQCVCVNVHGLSENDAGVILPDLERFAKQGGGLIVSATPWAASPKAQDFAAKLLNPASLSFLTSGPSDTRYPLTSLPSPYGSGIRGLLALSQEQAGTISLTLADRQIAANSVESCVASNLVSPALEQGLLAMHQKTGWSRISIEQPLRKNLKPVEALMARFEMWWLRKQPAAKTPPHPRAADYPGMPSAGPVITKTFTFNASTGPDKLVNHGERTRVSTGLYARPGDMLEIQIPPEAMGAGWKAEIGIHTDKTWNLASWRRFPEISVAAELNAPATQVANSFGGLVSLLIPADCKQGEVSVTIKGGVEAPVYTLGKTTAQEWKKARQAPGAWGYLETPLWTGYFSREQLNAMEHPDEIAQYWHKAVELADHFLGYATWRKRGESMLVDRDVSVGYGHAGYPVMMAYGAETKDGPDALLGRGPAKGDWGFLHELGHTFQDSFDGNYTIATHAEVDVNLVPGLIIRHLHGRTCWDNDSHPTFNARTRQSDWDIWMKLPAAEQTWSKACKMNVAYDFYFTLAECFGWELYERAFGRLMRWLQKAGPDAALDSIPPNSPSSKRDRFFVLFSEESGYNLAPFFEKYGLGKGDFAIGEEARERVSQMPVWRGNRPVESLTGPTEVKLARQTVLPSEIGQFRGKDPDPGTIFTYRILMGNDDGAFSIGKRTGALTLIKAIAEDIRVLDIEVQDNCVPLSTARTQCRVQTR